MEDLYRERCHSRKDRGSPAPEMRVQNSQSPSPLWPTMNLRLSRAPSKHQTCILTQLSEGHCHKPCGMRKGAPTVQMWHTKSKVCSQLAAAHMRL